MQPIAHIETPFKTKFGVPRQAGLADYRALVVFEPEYRIPEAVRGLDEFDYIWLIWQFHLNNNDTNSSFKPTVRPPRLGGNKRVGVFATRSPFRPNALGLSSVRLLDVSLDPQRGPLLTVAGADLVDGTPIFDIKPYLPYADSHPDARGGFATTSPGPALSVADPEGRLRLLDDDLRRALVDTIALDPRPHYQDDPSRLYAILFDRYEVKFRVAATTATITSITPHS